MDLKKKYTEETGEKPYCLTKSGMYVKSGSYSDGYVKWLEKQLLIHSVVGQSEQLCKHKRVIKSRLRMVEGKSRYCKRCQGWII
jgi:hypothetical protein